MWTIEYNNNRTLKAEKVEINGTYLTYGSEKCVFGSLGLNWVHRVYETDNESNVFYDKSKHPREYLKEMENILLSFKNNKPMKKVIRLDEPKEESKKPVQFTHYFNAKQWVKESFTSEEYEKIVYLGYDSLEGDMFACYINKSIVICKGNLNDGVY